MNHEIILPDEILAHVFSHLPMQDVLRLRLVCKRFEVVTRLFPFAARIHPGRSVHNLRNPLATESAVSFLQKCRNTVVEVHELLLPFLRRIQGIVGITRKLSFECVSISEFGLRVVSLLPVDATRFSVRCTMPAAPPSATLFFRALSDFFRRAADTLEQFDLHYPTIPLISVPDFIPSLALCTQLHTLCLPMHVDSFAESNVQALRSLPSVTSLSFAPSLEVSPEWCLALASHWLPQLRVLRLFPFACLHLLAQSSDRNTLPALEVLEVAPRGKLACGPGSLVDCLRALHIPLLQTLDMVSLFTYGTGVSTAFKDDELHYLATAYPKLRSLRGYFTAVTMQAMLSYPNLIGALWHLKVTSEDFLQRAAAHCTSLEVCDWVVSSSDPRIPRARLRQAISQLGGTLRVLSLRSEALSVPAASEVVAAIAEALPTLRCLEELVVYLSPFTPMLELLQGCARSTARSLKFCLLHRDTALWEHLRRHCVTPATALFANSSLREVHVSVPLTAVEVSEKLSHLLGQFPHISLLSIVGAPSELQKADGDAADEILRCIARSTTKLRSLTFNLGCAHSADALDAVLTALPLLTDLTISGRSSASVLSGGAARADEALLDAVRKHAARLDKVRLDVRLPNDFVQKCPWIVFGGAQ